jgi:hypothetical protein
MPELIFAKAAFDRDIHLRSLKEAVDELNRLRTVREVVLSPGWDLPHVLDHCARSIEYAMDGFPVQRNRAFQIFLGKTAFRLFDLRGEMSHNLAEEIPGSKPTPASRSFETAMAELLQTIDKFESYDGPLQPHFTYGPLTKDEYDRANSMHIANHLSAMKF